MIEILSHGYSSESTQWELSNEYKHDSVWMIFKISASMCFGRMQPQHWKGLRGDDDCDDKDNNENKDNVDKDMMWW